MKITQYISDSHTFQRAFIDYNRGDQYTNAGFEALYDHFEECYGEDYELDVIGICCTFTEHDSLEDYYEAYSRHTHDECDAHIVAVTERGTILVEDW